MKQEAQDIKKAKFIEAVMSMSPMTFNELWEYIDENFETKEVVEDSQPVRLTSNLAQDIEQSWEDQLRENLEDVANMIIEACHNEELANHADTLLSAMHAKQVFIVAEALHKAKMEMFELCKSEVHAELRAVKLHGHMTHQMGRELSLKDALNRLETLRQKHISDFRNGADN